MNEKDALEKLNELEVTDVDFDGTDVAYVHVEDNKDNRKRLVELGLSETDIADMQVEKGALDITVFAFDKCGADWYQHGVGFGKNEIRTQDAVVIYSNKVLAEVTERAVQEDAPIYEEDKEVDLWVRLSDVEDAINKYLN